MNKTDITQQTYNDKAADFAEYFGGFESRKQEVDFAFSQLEIEPKQARVLELGCGDGRDAAEILKKTRHYTGIDYADSLIGIAKARYPDQADSFRVADMRQLELVAASYDAVFAFASLIHLDSTELDTCLQQIYASLTSGGVICLCFKRAPRYTNKLQKDKFGERIFYLYSPDEISAKLGGRYQLLSQLNYNLSSVDWITIFAKKF